MVRKLQDCDSTRDRAQLILVGSIALAFIIIGLVVVFNTVLFTDNLAAQGSVGEIENAQEFQQQVERDMPELVRHVENGTDSNPAFSGNVDGNVSTTYNRLLAETYADGSPTYVNVTFNESSSTFGTRVVQDGGEFVNNGNNGNWDPVTDRNVSEFTMNVSVAEVSNSGTDFEMMLTGDSGSNVELEMWYDGSELAINQTDDTNDPTCSIPPGADGAVVINVSDGSSEGTCTFDSLDNLSAPYTVEFTNGDQAGGQYTFLSNGTISSGTNYNGRNGSSPYVNHVLLEAGVDLYYQSRTVTYVSNQTITVREVPQ